MLLLLVVSQAVSTDGAAAARTTGDEPLDEILDAATANARCGLTRDRLAAIVLAPTFPETGAPVSRAPSPMTLSRWDNQSALYAFGDASTPYEEAFWHPGIGQWQFDEAGGWAMTAAERIDSRASALRAADVMATRWCANPTLSYVWAPWYGCGGGVCQAIYDDLYDGTSLQHLATEAVGRLGGMEGRSCRIDGATDVACWYIDPAAAEGYGGFATPAFGPSPISAPFYVWESGGEELRHWSPEDTAYPLGITAHLEQGRNSRTHLTWEHATWLCDLTAGRGQCDPPPPPGCGEAAATGPFTDVTPQHVFCDEILWLVEQGIADGFVDGSFHPVDALSRQAMAAFLWRWAGEPAVVVPSPSSFADVPPTHPFVEPVEWMAAVGLAGGFPDGTFRPGAGLSRQAMAAFLFRADALVQ